MKKYLLGIIVMTTISAQFVLTSPDFKAGKTIPTQFTGEGANKAPGLNWSGAPKNTKAFALIVDDPDAPAEEPFVHWVVYNIPADRKDLNTLGDVTQGENSYQHMQYDGPKPPKGHGIHHYHFKLYALDTMLALQQAVTKNELLAAMQGHIIAQTELIGTYEKK